MEWKNYNLNNYEASTGVEDNIVEECQEDTWTILDALNIAVKKINADEVTPAEYFSILKSQKHKISNNALNKSYDACLQLADKYAKLGQLAGLKRIGFQMACIIQERKLIETGITTYVYKEDLMTYVDKVKDKSIKICYLKDYEREIPDEVSETILSVKDIFDEFVVVYTDYTVKETLKTKAFIKHKEKDPIIFGIFTDKENIFTLDRLYYIADWVDEYCDLTLDKLVEEYKNMTNRHITRTLSTPLTLDAVKEQIKRLETKDASSGFYKVTEDTPSKKKTFFEKVSTFFSRKR